MTATASRLLGLLSLLQTRRDWPGGELATGCRCPVEQSAETSRGTATSVTRCSR